MECVQFPDEILSPFITCFWYHKDVSFDYSRDKLLPDGTVQLIIDLTPEPKKLYASETSLCYTEFTKAWISGGHTKYIVIEAAKKSSMIGIAFKPGGAYNFFNIPLSEIKNQVVPLADFAPHILSQLRDAIMERETPDEKFAVLSGCMHSLLRDRNQTNPVMQYSFRMLQQSASDISIRTLADKTGYTQKHLISLFERYTGLTPKEYQRLCRFQNVLKQIENMQSLSWASVAGSCGYYDQSHFIHDFKKFSGINPVQYLRSKGDYFGYIPLYE